MKKRILSVLLAVSCMAMVMAGCGGKEDAPEAETAGKEETAEEATAGEDETDAQEEESGAAAMIAGVESGPWRIAGDWKG